MSSALSQILAEQEGIIDSMLSLLLEERRTLRGDAAGVMQDLLSDKRQLIDALSISIDKVRSLRDAGPYISIDDRSTLQRLQQKLNQLLQLDRDLEKFILAGTMPRTEQPVVPVASALTAARAYQQQPKRVHDREVESE